MSAAALPAPPAHADEMTLLAEVGPERVRSEYFGRVEPALSYRSERLNLELAAPLRLRLNEAHAERYGRLRSSDWDALSDAGRVLRRFDLELGERALVLRLGALGEQSVGHGTVVSGYSNGVDLERLPVGLAARLAHGPVALELLASDVLGLGVLGANASLEALSVLGWRSDRLHLTASFFADPRAPRGPDTPYAAIAGVGLDVVAVLSEWLSLAPYVDLNARDFDDGAGLHAGLLLDVTRGPVALGLKLEWRRTTGRYRPEYFDVGYALDRWDARMGQPGPDAPKADWAPRASNTARGELRVAWTGFSVSAGLSVLPEGGADGSGVVRLELDKWELAGFLAARGGAYARTLWVAEGRCRLLPYLHAWASAGRLYEVRDGALHPATLLGAGLGTALAL